MAANGDLSGFTDRGMDESNFGESSALKAVKAFDAFPKTKPDYTQQTGAGGVWTVILVVASVWLAATELGRWWVGETTHAFNVEAGVGHDLQINLDVIVRMKCEDLHVNLQDASGDRIMASQPLKKEPTTWKQWSKDHSHALGVTKEERLDFGQSVAEYRQQDVHDFLHAAMRGKYFKKTPRLPRGVEADSCRIDGKMHTNKVQGDFHITARGHGYMEVGPHLGHDGMSPRALTLIAFC